MEEARDDHVDDGGEAEDEGHDVERPPPGREGAGDAHGSQRPERAGDARELDPPGGEVERIPSQLQDDEGRAVSVERGAVTIVQ